MLTAGYIARIANAIVTTLINIQANENAEASIFEDEFFDLVLMILVFQ